MVYPLSNSILSQLEKVGLSCWFIDFIDGDVAAEPVDELWHDNTYERMPETNNQTTTLFPFP